VRCLFCSCTKEYQKRPKYKELLQDDFVRRYETTYVDITWWLRSVLEPPTPSSFSRPSTQPSSSDQPNDPFAFAGEVTRAQFAKHSRTRSLGMPLDFARKPASK